MARKFRSYLPDSYMIRPIFDTYANRQVAGAQSIYQLTGSTYTPTDIAESLGFPAAGSHNGTSFATVASATGAGEILGLVVTNCDPAIGSTYPGGSMRLTIDNQVVYNDVVFPQVAGYGALTAMVGTLSNIYNGTIGLGFSYGSLPFRANYTIEVLTTQNTKPITVFLLTRRVR